MRKWLIRGGVAFALLFAAWVVYVIRAAFYWQMMVGAILERDLGFQHGTPYVLYTGSDWLHEVLTVESVTPGGVFEQAGFQRGDIILDLSITELFQLLQQGRGQSVTIRVADGGDGPPIAERRVRVITIMVPPSR
jgi:hypothetical protein